MSKKGRGRGGGGMALDEELEGEEAGAESSEDEDDVTKDTMIKVRAFQEVVYIQVPCMCLN